MNEVNTLKTQRDRRRWLIRTLLEDMPQYQYPVFPYTQERRQRLLRSLMNVRPPRPVSEEFLRVQDVYLQEMTREKGITDADSLAPCPVNSWVFSGRAISPPCVAMPL